MKNWINMGLLGGYTFILLMIKIFIRENLNIGKLDIKYFKISTLNIINILIKS